MNADLLSQLRPAETLLLVHGRSVMLKDFLKVTLMDLLLKQVLTTLEVTRPGSSTEPAQPLTYVTVGKNFKGYSGEEFEEIFLSPFYKSPDGQVLFQNLIRIGHEHARNARHFMIMLLKSKSIRHYFSRGLMERVYGGFSMSQQGAQVSERLKHEVAEMENKLPFLLEHDPDRAMQVMKTIGGNIFVLKNIPIPRMKDIETYVSEELETRPPAETRPTGTEIPGFEAWIFLTEISTHYDHTWDHHHSHGDGNLGSDSDWGGDGDSGCGGDSGCSGCGGGD
jgi:hypothetical protein